jgi:hypothetical protein
MTQAFYRGYMCVKVIFQVLTAIGSKMVFFWDVMPCRLVNTDRCFRSLLSLSSWCVALKADVFYVRNVQCMCCTVVRKSVAKEEEVLFLIRRKLMAP